MQTEKVSYFVMKFSIFCCLIYIPDKKVRIFWNSFLDKHKLTFDKSVYCILFRIQTAYTKYVKWCFCTRWENVERDKIVHEHNGPIVGTLSIKVELRHTWGPFSNYVDKTQWSGWAKSVQIIINGEILLWYVIFAY